MNQPRRNKAQLLAARLVSAASKRQGLDLGASPPLDGDTLRAALIEADGSGGVARLRIHNLSVLGDLDLEDLEFSSALTFESLQVTNLGMSGARIPGLVIVGGSLEQLSAHLLSVRGDLRISGLSIPNTLDSGVGVDFTGVRVGGDLQISDVSIGSGRSTAIVMDGAKVDGSVLMTSISTVAAGLRCQNLRVGGSMEILGVQLQASGGPSLDVSRSMIRGDLRFGIDIRRTPSDMSGGLDASACTVDGSISVSGSVIRSGGATGTAISFERSIVKGEVNFAESAIPQGHVDLSAIRVSGSVRVACSLSNPASQAIALNKCEVGGDVLFEPGISGSSLGIRGAITATEAHIKGSLVLRNVDLGDAPPDTLGRGGPDPLLDAARVVVDGNVDLRCLRTAGGPVWFGLAKVTGWVDLRGATLVNVGAHAVSFHQAEIGGTVHIGSSTPGNTTTPRPFVARGLTAFNQVHIGGRLLIEGGTFSWEGPPNQANNWLGCALEAIAARVDVGMVLAWTSVTGLIDFSRASTGYLADEPKNWGGQARLAGFEYRRFASLPGQVDGSGNWDLEQRSQWLRGQHSKDPEVWEYAASVFRNRGLARSADALLISGRRTARKTSQLTGARRASIALDWLYEKLVGYGRRPERSIVCIAVLLLSTTVVCHLGYQSGLLRASDERGAVFTSDGVLPGSLDIRDLNETSELSNECGGGRVPCCNAAWFTVDTVVPLISLDQRTTWRPVTNRLPGALLQWWLYVVTFLGWALSSVAAIALARRAAVGHAG